MTAPAADPPVGPARSASALVPDRVAIATAASVAALVLAGTSTGSLVVAALLLGVGTLDRRSGAAALLAALAVAMRFNTATLDDLAGIQSVLGPAVSVGPATAAASAWCAAAAVVLAVRIPEDDDGLGRARWPVRIAPAAAAGTLAAALAAGPGPDDLLVRLGASVVGIAVALAVSTVGRRRLARVRVWTAVAVGVAAVVLAGWPA